MLYFQKSISEKARNAVLGGKIRLFLRECQTPYICYVGRLTTNSNLSSLHTRHSMVPFCKCPPTDEFFKKALELKVFCSFGSFLKKCYVLLINVSNFTQNFESLRVLYFTQI